MKYYVYIIKSRKNNSYYIGQTIDFKKRLAKHNDGKVRSTKRYAPYNLKFIKEYETRSAAIRFERYLKSLKSRSYLEKVFLGGLSSVG